MRKSKNNLNLCELFDEKNYLFDHYVQELSLGWHFVVIRDWAFLFQARLKFPGDANHGISENP